MDIAKNLENFVVKISSVADSVMFCNITGLPAFKIPFLVAWIAIGGLYFTYKFRFISISRLFYSLRLAFSSKLEKSQIASLKGKDISTSKKIVLTGIGEAIDVSAIFGVVTAVMIGGPGVLFWMLIAGFVSMPIRFVEVSLGHMTRVYDAKTGQTHGGPQRYISVIFRAIKLPGLGRFASILFSICVIMSTFFSPQINQTMNIARYIVPSFQEYILLSSTLIAILVIMIVLSGFRSITIIVSKMVKIMSVLYVLVCGVIIFQNAGKIPGAMQLIFHDAFSFRAVEGSLFFIAILGCKRTFFSCDVGQGVSSIGHVNSANKNSIQEGIISMSGILIITLIATFCSGMIVVVTDVYLTEKNAMFAVIGAFNSVNQYLKYSLFVIVPMFAITTAVSWGYFGQKAFISLFGKKYANVYFVLLFCAYIMCGVTQDFRVILDVADIFNLSIALPNMIAVLIGSRFVYKRYRKFLASEAAR